MKIHILEKGFQKKHPYKRLREYIFRPYWFPVQNSVYELKDIDVKVKFFTDFSDKIFDCDILILSSRTVERICSENNSIYKSRSEFCAAAKGKANRLIWFDSRDSAGNCQFDVIPFVDVYLKRQLYRDRSIYLKNLYGGRVYSDYYHRHYGVTEDAPGEGQDVPFSSHEIASDISLTSKMRAAWGCGAEFHWPLLTPPVTQAVYFAKQYMHRFCRNIYAVPETVAPSLQRHINISALFDHKRYSMKTVGYQRRIGLEHAQRLATSQKITGRVPNKQFYGTLRGSAIAVSVFGWGEVCYREYEATYCGAGILMADMSGIETYPNFYQAGIYYTPFLWDFSDFEEKFHYLIDNPDVRIGMAENAQKLLLNQWSRDGRESFARRFVNLISGSVANIVVTGE